MHSSLRFGSDSRVLFDLSRLKDFVGLVLIVEAFLLFIVCLADRSYVNASVVTLGAAVASFLALHISEKRRIFFSFIFVGFMRDPLSPMRLGDKGRYTMLSSVLNPSCGPSIVYLYGPRHVGKTYALNSLIEENVKYFDARSERVTVRDVMKALEEYDVVLLDEATYLELGSYRGLPGFLEGVHKKIRGTKKKLVFTTSYSAEHYEILDTLVRLYAKDLEPPRDKEGNVQPYRIHALPRTLLEASSYRTGEKYEDSPNILDAILPNDSRASIPKGPREVLDAYLITGGYPTMISSLKPPIEYPSTLQEFLSIASELKGVEYIVQELTRVSGGKIERIKNALLGLGDKIVKRSKERLEVFKTYVVFGVPVANEFIRRNMSVEEFEYFKPKPLDPGSLTALIYYLAPEDVNINQILGAALESFVLLHLLYIVSSTPKTRSRKVPPIVSPKEGPDFIATLFLRYKPVPLIVEVKARSLAETDLMEGSEFYKTLKSLALYGYRNSVYPILVARRKPASEIYVNIEASEEDRKEHSRNRTRLFLGSSPYKDVGTRKVIIMEPQEFARFSKIST